MATSAPKAVPKAVPKAGAEVADETAAPAKKSKKKLVMMLAAAVLLAGGGGGAAWFFLGHKAESAEKHPKVEAPKPPVFVVMEPFTVNLQTDGVDQFLQVAFTLQAASNEEVDLIKTYMPQVRSRLLLLLSSKHAADINTPAGKKALGAEIAAAVNQPFTPGGKKQEVSDVFFTSFVIQ